MVLIVRKKHYELFCGVFRKGVKVYLEVLKCP